MRPTAVAMWRLRAKAPSVSQVAKLPRNTRPFYEDIDHWDNVMCADGRVSLLNLRMNGLTGELPRELWDLERLVTLNLSSNNLEGKLPRGISQLFALQVLQLENNNFQGNVPRELSKCTRLRVLNLSDNAFEGTVPTSLGRCVELRELSLTNNKLEGELTLAHVEALRSARSLSCESTRTSTSPYPD